MQDNTIKAIKGFNTDMTCRGFQYEEGQTYKHDGPPARCTESGFHAIDGNPLSVFSFYPPTKSVYHEAVCGGDIDRDGIGSKITASEITIHARLELRELIARAVDWISAKAKREGDKQLATGYGSSAASNGERSSAVSNGERSSAASTGYRSNAASNGYVSNAASNGRWTSAASNGNWSSAASTGDWSSAASNGNGSNAVSTGDRSNAASNGRWTSAASTGDWSSAVSTGDWSSAASNGKHSVAMSAGLDGMAKGAKGCALFLVERNDDGEIIAAWAGIVGKKRIKPDTFYTLNNGKPVEVE